MGGAVTRRSVIIGGGLAATGLLGLGAVAPASAGRAGAAPGASPRGAHTSRIPLWLRAKSKGIVFGSSTATWQIEPDPDYRELFQREAGILFTEDDLLWYRLRPTPDSGLDFTFGDRIIGFAEGNGQRVFGAHLVWDEGFGEGWTDDDLWGMTKKRARETLFGTIEAEVRRYRGRIAAWSVANEVTDPNESDNNGFRTNVPWYETIGPSYVADSFHLAHAEDPDAVLVINEFGFETVNEWGDRPEPRRDAALRVIDKLLHDDVPVHALGVQAHLLAEDFAGRFDAAGYRRFLADVADRGLTIMITEMDVLDDGLPADPIKRDKGVADAYQRYLDVALDEPAVKVVMTFGLSDRYTWLEEDFPREDGAPRRPLPFDADLRPKPAYRALSRALANAPRRQCLW